MGLVTLTFDLLTLKLVYESHQRWETFLPNLGTLGLWVLVYATDGQTDRQTDGQTKATLIAPFPTGGDITVCSQSIMPPDIRLVAGVGNTDVRATATPLA